MARYFEKISFEQFSKDISKDNEIYLDYRMPKRSTKYAAGYDFYAIYGLKIKPGEIVRIPTGIKVNMEDDDALLLMDRSSMGFKYNIRFTNQVGLIDKDYYNNKENEGHMWVSLQNEGSKIYSIKKGEAFCQGVFIKYLKVDNESNEFVNRLGNY